jgi:hypothetical protein
MLKNVHAQLLTFLLATVDVVDAEDCLDFLTFCEDVFSTKEGENSVSKVRKLHWHLKKDLTSGDGVSSASVSLNILLSLSYLVSALVCLFSICASCLSIRLPHSALSFLCTVSTSLLGLGAVNGLVLPLFIMGRHELTKTIVDYDKKDEENNKQEDNEGKSMFLNKVSLSVIFSSSSLSSSESLSSCGLVSASWVSLIAVLCLISRLFRSTICRYVSFKRGMNEL